MRGSNSIDTIDASSLQAAKDRYNTVVPKKLDVLDEERYEKIPQAVAARGDAPYLTKDELITLVEWKVSHGKFRPTLKGLALQNADSIVETITEEAFSIDDTQGALKSLTRLRGVGPATASLLLAVYKPHNVPFFSDELFRWCFYEDGAGRGWDRKIKYTPKEYADMVERVKALQERLAIEHESPNAVAIEKAAYVLAKETQPEEENTNQVGTPRTTSKKRKADNTDSARHGDQSGMASRRSSRREKLR